MKREQDLKIEIDRLNAELAKKVRDFKESNEKLNEKHERELKEERDKYAALQKQFAEFKV